MAPGGGSSPATRGGRGPAPPCPSPGTTAAVRRRWRRLDGWASHVDWVEHILLLVPSFHLFFRLCICLTVSDFCILHGRPPCSMLSNQYVLFDRRLSELEVKVNKLGYYSHNIVSVTRRCEFLINMVKSDNAQPYMDHSFFDAAERLSKRLEASAVRSDYPTDGKFLSQVSLLQSALIQFRSWRQRIRSLTRDIHLCEVEINQFVVTPHPSEYNIGHIMGRGVRIVSTIRSLPRRYIRHVLFAERLLECIKHVKAQSVYRTHASSNEFGTEALSEEIRLLCSLFEDTDLAKEVEDRFGPFFQPDQERLNPSVTRAAVCHAHDLAANLRRSHLQHGLLMDWLSANHEQAHYDFLAHVDDLVESQQHPSAEVSFR